MGVFSDASITRFLAQGESELSSERPFLVERVSLEIEEGTSVYTLDDSVRSIRRVTYKGIKLDPMSRRLQREIFQSATQRSKPFWYIYNNIGLNQIQLFPCPAEDVAEVTDVWDDEISTGVIVEYYRIADGTTYITPSWIRRQLLKLYIAKQCFAIEGAGQNLKASDYFDKRWELKKNEFYSLLDELYNKSRKLIIGTGSEDNYFPTSPILPIDRYGISVDEGY